MGSPQPQIPRLSEEGSTWSGIAATGREHSMRAALQSRSREALKCSPGVDDGFCIAPRRHLLIALLSIVVTVLLVFWIGESERRRGLLPPRLEARANEEIVWVAGRRMVAYFVLTVALYIGVMAPVALLSFTPVEPLLPSSTAQLFVLHAIFAGVLVVWFAVGHLPRQSGEPGLLAVLGLTKDPNPIRELGLGTVIGFGIWGAVVVALVAVGLAVQSLSGAEAPAPPPMVLWMAAMPVWLRLAVSLSAGVFEEVFFRGFLQPRIGIPLSTVLFAMAHLSYAQPTMLVGVTLLSLCYAFLTEWRGSVWAAISAHTVFDAVQLIGVIPVVARQLETVSPMIGG